MAAITTRAWRGELDLPLVADLLRCMPRSTRHLIDLPWRLSSLARDGDENAHVWQHEAGWLVGLAAWQSAWATLDFFVRPGMYEAAVEAAIFHWVDQRFRQLDEGRGSPLPYWIDFREDDSERQQLIEAHGFLLQDEQRKIQFEHPLGDSPSAVSIPGGFTLRSFAGAGEVDAYVALHRAAFKSTAMTPGWRMRSLHAPQYQPGLDLVAVAPGGRLAGFCIGWLDGERYIGQIEPMGIHPNFQHLGLGHALLIEMLRRLKAHHASRVLVETESTRLDAQALYTSLGFRPLAHILRRGKWSSIVKEQAG